MKSLVNHVDHIGSTGSGHMICMWSREWSSTVKWQITLARLVMECVLYRLHDCVLHILNFKYHIQPRNIIQRPPRNRFEILTPNNIWHSDHLAQRKIPQWYQFYPFCSTTPQSKCIFGLETRVRVNMVPLSINHWQKNMNWFTIMIPQTPQTTTKFIELRPTSNFNKITRENRYLNEKRH